VSVHHRFFGFGEEVATWLYSYQPPGAGGQRCWYYKEVAASDPEFHLPAGLLQWKAVRTAERLVTFPLADSHVVEHLRFWGAVRLGAALLDYAQGTATCPEAIIGIAVSFIFPPLAPAMFWPTAGAVAMCGLAIYGLTQLPDVTGHIAAPFLVSATEVLDAGSMTRETWETQKALRDAVQAKRSRQDTTSAPCPPADLVTKPFAQLFSRDDLEACARLTSIENRALALPGHCQHNGFALGVGAGFCAVVRRAGSGGAGVYRDRDFSRALGFAGNGTVLEVLERHVHRYAAQQLVVLRVRRRAGSFDRGGAREAWILPGYLEATTEACR
jgi:hypothetical protein